MNNSLLAAATLTLVIGGVHSWLGERRLLGPLLAPAQRAGMLARSEFARQVLRFAWHLTTLAWWGIAAMLVALGLGELNGGGRLVLGIIALTFALTGATILVTSRGRHLAWPVFFAVAGLSASPLL